MHPATDATDAHDASPTPPAAPGPSGADVDVLDHRCRHHRDLPALPGPRGRVLRPAGRGRRRRRGHLVLEPLPRGPFRLGELHLRLPVLRGAVRGVGVAGALRRAARDRALPQPRGGPLRAAGATCASAPAVTAADYEEGSGTWPSRPATAPSYRARFVVAATGVLSVPYFPTSPAATRSAACRTTPAGGRRSPSTSRASGSPSSAPARAACRSFPPSPARWRRSRCTNGPPTGARRSTTAPITPEEQARLQAGFEAMRDVLDTSPSGFHHPTHDRGAFEDPDRPAPGLLREDVAQPRVHQADEQLPRPDSPTQGKRRVVRVHRRQDPRHRHDPETAERLIPNDHRFGEKRPPFVAGYYETFNRPNVSLVDLGRTRWCASPPAGIETTDGLREFDVIVWATGFDFGTGALVAHGHPRPRTAWPSPSTGRTAQAHSSASGPPASPTSSSPAARTPRRATTRATTATRWTSSPTLLVYARDHGDDIIEVDPGAEERWTRMIDTGAGPSPFGEKSYYFGTNIPGKPQQVPAELGRAARSSSPRRSGRVVANNYKAFRLSGPSLRPRRSRRLPAADRLRATPWRSA